MIEEGPEAAGYSPAEMPSVSAGGGEADRPTMPGPQPDTFWEESASGIRLLSRPIVVDGLKVRKARIELAPRVIESRGQLVDDSYSAVDFMASQFVRLFTLEQLVMSTVALRVHMRRSREFLERRRVLHESWTTVARRLMKLRAEGERVRWRAESHAERCLEASVWTEPRPDVEALLRLEGEEIAEVRAALEREAASAWEAWSELEKEDAILLKAAPYFDQTKDLRQPYVLTLVAPREDGAGRVARSLSTAMHTLVQALQKPLSRTDQMLLEIAFRRCIRDAVPEEEARDVEGWERRLLERAGAAYALEFPWAGRFVDGS